MFVAGKAWEDRHKPRMPEKDGFYAVKLVGRWEICRVGDWKEFTNKCGPVWVTNRDTMLCEVGQETKWVKLE